ncbi:MAG: hypothetical protein AAGD13_05935 [Pseudomonadota bacterium]
METTLRMINTFKLKQGKHCSRLFYYCADNWVPAEAIFYLAAERYIFTKDLRMARVFTDVLWLKTGDLALNLQFNDFAVLRKMISSPEIKVNQGTAKHTNFINRGGMQLGSAGDYNVITRAIEYCATQVSQSTIVAGVRIVQGGGELPDEKNQAARSTAKEHVTEHIGPLLGADALKQLGVFL